mgnify:CR=1 FL=1
MTEQEFKQKEEKIKQRPKFKKPSTSKIVLFIVFMICIQILWFSEHMAIVTGDTSYMYALIGVPCALIPTVLGYFHKSKCENVQGGITYDMAMSQANDDAYSSTSDDDSDNGAVG